MAPGFVLAGANNTQKSPHISAEASFTNDYILRISPLVSSEM